MNDLDHFPSERPVPTTHLEPHFRVRFWGVRGSLAAPGKDTAKVGGNTSCVTIEDDETTLVFDAGTGIRACGTELIHRQRRDVHLFFSHLHWDHIQGFPFFGPIYDPARTLHIHGPAPIAVLKETLTRQMQPPNFPVRLSDLKSTIELHEVYPGTTRGIGRLSLTAARLNHPGGVLGYRVTLGKRTIVYTTDHEHGTDADERLTALALGADVLIYDAMYTPEEYSGAVGPSKVGWGHSTFEQATRIARKAGVQELILFHHDPCRSDEQVERIVDRAKQSFSRVRAAQEGLTLEWGGAAATASKGPRVA